MPPQPKTTRPYTRGMYRMPEPWSKDTSQAYYKGTTTQVVWPLVKLFCLASIFFLLQFVLEVSTSLSCFACFIVIWFYQDVVAKIMGLKRMAALDAQCFVSSSKSHVNMLSVS